MSKTDAATIWALNYRLLMTVIMGVSPEITALGIEVKELFVLAAIEGHPYPAELAAALTMPKPTLTANLKRLEAAGLVQREIDPADLRRHRLQLTAAGRKLATRGVGLLSDAFGARLRRLTAAQQAEFQALLEKLS